jgi:signal peptidase II
MPVRNIGRVLIVAALVFLADRILKIWVLDGLGLRERFYIEVADPWLNLRMAWNQGINFGILNLGDSGRWVLTAIAVAIVAALLIWVRHKSGLIHVLGAGLVVGGALGNVWDRIQYGAVADFINMSCCGIDNPFAFNLADAAIFAGAGLLILAQGEPAGEGATGRDAR